MWPLCTCRLRDAGSCPLPGADPYLTFSLLAAEREVAPGTGEQSPADSPAGRLPRRHSLLSLLKCTPRFSGFLSGPPLQSESEPFVIGILPRGWLMRSNRSLNHFYSLEKGLGASSLPSTSVGSWEACKMHILTLTQGAGLLLVLGKAWQGHLEEKELGTIPRCGSYSALETRLIIGLLSHSAAFPELALNSKLGRIQVACGRM